MGFSFKKLFNTNGLKRTVSRITNTNGLKRNIGKISTVVGGVLAATGIGAPLGAAVAALGNGVSSVVNSVGSVLTEAGKDQISKGQDLVNQGTAVQNTTAEGLKDNLIKPALLIGGLGVGAFMLFGKKSKSYRRR